MTSGCLVPCICRDRVSPDKFGGKNDGGHRISDHRDDIPKTEILALDYSVEECARCSHDQRVTTDLPSELWLVGRSANEMK